MKAEGCTYLNNGSIVCVVWFSVLLVITLLRFYGQKRKSIFLIALGIRFLIVTGRLEKAGQITTLFRGASSEDRLGS